MHLKILVVGEDIQEQLHPFHIYRVTQVLDKRVKFIPVSKATVEHELKTFIEDYENDYESFEDYMDEVWDYIKIDEVYGYHINPNEKWHTYKLQSNYFPPFLTTDNKRVYTCQWHELSYHEVENFRFYAVIKDTIWYDLKDFNKERKWEILSKISPKEKVTIVDISR